MTTGLSALHDSASNLHPNFPAGLVWPPSTKEHTVLEDGGDNCEHEEAKESWMPCECIALQTRGCESILKPSVVSSARFTNGAPEQSAVLSNLMSACWGWVRWVGTCFRVSGCVSTCTEPYSISLRIHVQKCCNYIKQSKHPKPCIRHLN